MPTTARPRRTKPPALRACTYRRISDDESNDEKGVARQLKDAKALIAREAWSNVGDFCDNDLSASRYAKKSRPAYMAMIEAVERRDVDVIVVWHIDRLYRQPKELEQLIDLAEEVGIRVHTMTGKIDLMDSDGRAWARVLVTMAAKSSDDSSRRIRRKHLELAEAGRPKGGVRPYGFSPTNHVDVLAEEAKVIGEVASRFLAGDSFRTIALDLNARHVLTAGGKQWRDATLRNMMLSPRVAGLRTHHGEIVGAATWKPIIDRGTWEQIVAKAKSTATGTHVRKHLLSNLVTCARCGAGMVGALDQSTGTHRYQCAKAPGKDNCGRMKILGAPVDELVIGMVLHRLNSPAFTDALAKRKSSGGAGDVASVVVQLETELDGLAALHGRGEISAREWAAARKPLAARLAKLREQLAGQARHSAVATPTQTGPLDRDAWDAMPIERQRAVLDAVLERIDVHGVGCDCDWCTKITRRRASEGVTRPTRGSTKVDLDRVRPLWRDRTTD